MSESQKFHRSLLTISCVSYCVSYVTGRSAWLCVPCSVFRVPCSVFRVPCSVFHVPNGQCVFLTVNKITVPWQNKFILASDVILNFRSWMVNCNTPSCQITLKKNSDFSTFYIIRNNTEITLMLWVTRTVYTKRALCNTFWNLNYSSAPVSTGNTFQDLPRWRETADNTERYI
jgi:hypothetical protein